MHRPSLARRRVGRGRLALLLSLAFCLPQYALAQQDGGAESDAPDASTGSQQQGPFPAAQPNNAADTAASDNETAATVSTAVPAWQLRGSVDVSETYTSNAQGSSTTTGNKSDYYTRGRLGLALSQQTAQIKTELRSAVSGLLYSRRHNLDRIATTANLINHTDAIPGIFTFDGRAFASPIELSRVGAISASDEPVSNNTRQSYGYLARPDLRLAFNTFATNDLSFAVGKVFFVQPAGVTNSPLPFAPPEDTRILSLNERLVSGTDFGRLQWALDGTATDTDRETASQRQRSGVGELAYAITREIKITGQFGYETFHASVPLSRDLDGPVALGGFVLTLGPNFTASASAGVRHRFPNYTADLQWKSESGRTTVLGKLTDTVGHPQEQLLNDLDSLTPESLGTLDDSPVALSSGGLALNNSIARNRRAQLDVSRSDGRTTLGFKLYGAIRDQLSLPLPVGGARHTVYGIDFNASRTISPVLSAEAEAGYSHAKEFGGQDTIERIGAGLSYTPAEQLSFYLTGRYIKRTATGASPATDLSEEIITIGVRHPF